MWRFIRGTPRTSLKFPGIRRRLPGSQLVNMQSVKFVRRPARLRNVLIGGSVVFVSFHIYRAYVIEPWIVAIERLDAQLTDKERQEIEKEARKPIFLPFPLTTKSVPSEPYRGTDPEWQAFIRINSDQELKQRLRTTLEDIARSAAENNPMLIRRYGNRWSIRRAWTDIDFPYRPPPRFLRSGIELRDDELVWTTKELDPGMAMRIQRILWPSPVAWSMFSFAGTLLKQNVFDVARYFGYEPARPTPDHGAATSAMKKTLERFQQQVTKDPGSVKDPATMANASKQQPRMPSPLPPGASVSSTNAARPQGNKDMVVEKNRTSPSPTGANAPDLSKGRSPKDLYPYETVRSHINGAWHDFRKSLSQKWAPLRAYPPRGSILVSGLVELEAPNGFVIIDIYAWWDPSTKKYDARSMFLRLRRMQDRQQSPRA